MGKEQASEMAKEIESPKNELEYVPLKELENGAAKLRFYPPTCNNNRKPGHGVSCVLTEVGPNHCIG